MTQQQKRLPDGEDGEIVLQQQAETRASGPLDSDQQLEQSKQSNDTPKEINGPKGLEPTRYGDWESKGRCYDF